MPSTSPTPLPTSPRLLRTAPRLRLAVFITALSGLVLGCQSLEGALEDNIDYRSAAPVGKNLEVPPDLTQLTNNTRYKRTGEGTVSAKEQSGASTNAAGNANASKEVLQLSAGDARILRTGDTPYLVIKRSPHELWDSVRSFWLDNGFLLTTDDAGLGILETDWAENRAKIPQDFIRTTLGKVLDSLYTTAERDRFRLRFDKNAQGETEIHLSHKGMMEDFDKDRTHTTWSPRPTDHELEHEMLRRLLRHLGAPAAAPDAAKPSNTTK